MANRTDYSPLQQHASEAQPPASRGLAAHWSIRTASITAGVALLLMSAVAIFGNVVVVDGLVSEGDAAQTAADIMASEGLFRLGIASLVVVIALDVVVAWALYRVFSPVNKSLSLLAMALRLVYSGVFMVAVGHLLGAVRLLSNDGYLAVFGADKVNAQAMLESCKGPKRTPATRLPHTDPCRRPTSSKSASARAGPRSSAHLA